MALKIRQQKRRRGTVKQAVYVMVAIVFFSYVFGAVVEAAPFTQGNKSVTISGGSGHAFGSDYFVLGVGGGYYLLDGLELGVDVDAWLGADPDIYRISPQVRYVFHKVDNIKSYVGTFFRRTFIEGLDDLDAVGFRGGVFMMLNRGSYLGVGAVYDSYLDCEERIYSSCSNTYPEIVISIAF